MIRNKEYLYFLVKTLFYIFCFSIIKRNYGLKYQSFRLNYFQG